MSNKTFQFWSWSYWSNQYCSQVNKSPYIRFPWPFVQNWHILITDIFEIYRLWCKGKYQFMADSIFYQTETRREYPIRKKSQCNFHRCLFLLVQIDSGYALSPNPFQWIMNVGRHCTILTKHDEVSIFLHPSRSKRRQTADWGGWCIEMSLSNCKNKLGPGLSSQIMNFPSGFMV